MTENSRVIMMDSVVLGQTRRDELLYFPGVDNISHHVGSKSKGGWTGGIVGGVPRCQQEWLERKLDWNLRTVYQHVAAEGRVAGTLFALVADHGLVGYKNDDRHNLHAEDGNGKEFQLLLEKMGSNLWRGKGKIADKRCVFSPNGGMAHVYVRKSEGGKWSDPPPLEGDVDTLATRIWLEAMGKRGVAYQRKDIWLPEMENCLGEVPLLLVRCDPLNRNLGSFDSEYWWLKEVSLDKDGKYQSLYRPVSEIPPSALPNPTIFREQLADMKDVRSGDIVMIMNSREGFGAFIPDDEDDGWHGGILMGETAVPMVFGMPYVSDYGFILEGYFAVSSWGGYQPNYRFAHILKEIVRANLRVE